MKAKNSCNIILCARKIVFLYYHSKVIWIIWSCLLKNKDLQIVTLQCIFSIWRNIHIWILNIKTLEPPVSFYLISYFCSHLNIKNWKKNVETMSSLSREAMDPACFQLSYTARNTHYSLLCVCVGATLLPLFGSRSVVFVPHSSQGCDVISQCHVLLPHRCICCWSWFN